MQKIRLIAWALVAIALGILAAIALGIGRDKNETVASSSIGGPFSLINQKGEAISDKTFLGKPTAIFFGFTHCPEICPTSLSDLTRWLAALGPDGDRLNVVFVTVDPERDTAAVLSDYLKAFDPRITGATGTSQQIAAILTGYRVYARKVPIEGTNDYTMDHSAAIYLMDRQGRFVVPLKYQEDDKTALEKLRRVLSS